MLKQTFLFALLLSGQAFGASSSGKKYEPGPVSWAVIVTTNKYQSYPKTLSDAEISDMVERGYLSKGGKIKCHLEFYSSWVEELMTKQKLYYEEIVRTPDSQTN